MLEATKKELRKMFEDAVKGYDKSLEQLYEFDTLIEYDIDAYHARGYNGLTCKESEELLEWLKGLRDIWYKPRIENLEYVRESTITTAKRLRLGCKFNKKRRR